MTLRRLIFELHHRKTNYVAMLSAKVQGCHVWKMNFFQVREKSGNFNFSQGNLEKMIKVRENLRSLKKNKLLKSSENHNFY